MQGIYITSSWTRVLPGLDDSTVYDGFIIYDDGLGRVPGRERYSWAILSFRCFHRPKVEAMAEERGIPGDFFFVQRPVPAPAPAHRASAAF